MIYDVQENHNAVSQSVKHSVVRGEVYAVEIRDAKPLPEVPWDHRLPDGLSPLAVLPKSHECRLDALPHRLGGLTALTGQKLPRTEALVEFLMDDDVVRPEWHTGP